jgi:hypothetical protein
VNAPITISYKWTPEEYRRFELAQELAQEPIRLTLSSRLVLNSRQGATEPKMSFRKRLVICVVMCAAISAGLVASTKVPGMGNPAQAYSVAIGFVMIFAVAFGWAVFRRRTTVSSISILAGVACACMAPTVTGYVPLASAWPYYLGMVLVPVGLFLVARIALQVWEWRMSVRLQQQLSKSPEVHWEVDADGPNVCFGGGERNTWDDIEYIVRTSDGFFLSFQSKQTETNTIVRSQRLFLWFPIHAFRAAAEVERFVSLAQAKVRRYEVDGALRQTTTP